jgi:predicted ATP-dependent protease
VLRADELRRRLDPARLGFSSTAEVEPLVGTIGQPRALDALEYGLEVTTRGFNLFVAGAPGSGRLSTVLDLIGARAPTKPRPDDWVYVHNFDNPDRPNAIRLPAGLGGELAKGMDEFVDAARREIPRAFESEEYQRRQREILVEIAQRRQRLEEELVRFASEHSHALTTSVTGVVSIPLVDGEPITRQQFNQLSAERQRAIASASKEVEDRTASFIHEVHQLENEAARHVRELDREVALFATEGLFRELEERFCNQLDVLRHLERIKAELVAHLPEFRASEGTDLPFALIGRRTDFAHFRVNVFVENGGLEGAPIVVERNPTYYNLLGRVEYRTTFGAMVTDFRDVKAGALHRANGGYLVLDMLDVLRHPFAWEGLKRALASEELRIENLAEEFSPIPSVTLRPETIPLDVKVVLLGSPLVHHLLYRLDEDFRELFKVKADFSPEFEWSPKQHRNYAGLISRWVRENELRHFDSAAVAKMIEHGARLREHQGKLSARLIEISDLVSEASFWAEKQGHALVQAGDVERAIRKKEYRSNLLEERVQELIRDGTIVIDTAGRRVGQVNGISILDLGDYSFGRPGRVTARVSLGRGRIASIEREIELSGPIHSKGFLTLSGYLAATYAQTTPLAVAATITFEQSYDEIEGDSASSTELYALLSALSDVPLDQGIAVTGSVDQHGAVQAVGGVTRKIEGFYATCAAQGLTGRQGVVIPAANVKHLMLDDEVVESVQNDRFHVWAIRNVDEGIELLTGLPAGRPGRDGTFPPESVHGLVMARLEGFAERLQALGDRGESFDSPPNRSS